MQRGESVPHFTVAALDGTTVRYADIWQRRNLVLILLPDDAAEEGAAYASDLGSVGHELESLGATCVATRDTVPGVPRPGVVVADRWGEIYFVGSTARVSDLPDRDEIVAWLQFIQTECPECQGEAW